MTVVFVSAAAGGELARHVQVVWGGDPDVEDDVEDDDVE